MSCMIEKYSIIQLLETLAHEVRLDVFLLLIRAGPDGLPAGELAERLGVAHNALSFHLTRMRSASLVRSRRNGKQIIYTADFTRTEGLVDFLSENCCRDNAGTCTPGCAVRRKRSSAAEDEKQVS